MWFGAVRTKDLEDISGEVALLTSVEHLQCRIHQRLVQEDFNLWTLVDAVTAHIVA